MATKPADKFHFDDSNRTVTKPSMPYPTENGDDSINRLTTGRLPLLKRGAPGIVRGKLRD
jgi:hypothetical protein